MIILQVLITEDNEIIEKADRILFEELWKPLGMPSNAREEFKAGAKEVVFIAIEDEQIIGTFVLVVYDSQLAEIRHAAVLSKYRNKSVGKQLFQNVRSYLRNQRINQLEVYSRNTSIGYWSRMGFVEVSDWLDHELFASHGIRFKKMVCLVEN